MFRADSLRRTMIIPATLLLILAGSWTVTVHAATPPTDTEIRSAVDDELIEDIVVPANFIDVSVSDGVATLEGTVWNILAKDRAERIATGIRGVRAVINQIDVTPPYRSDVEIREDVESALLTDPATDSYEVDVAVDDAKVTLTGTVDSMQEKELAGSVAKSTRGVQAIDNELDIDYAAERSDGEIRDEIVQTLLWDSRVDNALINVSVSDGDVTLSGTVGSAAERARARSDAWVMGVESVDASELDVRYWERDDRLQRDKYVARSDDEIEEAVQDAFLYDPRVTSFDISVDADGGEVTLRGQVDNLKAKRAAGTDARNVVGVWDVDNMIKVRPGTPSDRTIESNVEDAILRDAYLEAYQIDVVVSDGEVYLYGSVSSTWEKAHADDVAARQVGVTAVYNYLDVNDGADAVYGYDPYVDTWSIYDYDWYTPSLPTTTESDWEILEEINDELFWSPFVDSDAVTVTVDDGVATLTGTVDTWNERAAAAENAFEGGAIAVDNDLTVEYGPEYYGP